MPGFKVKLLALLEGRRAGEQGTGLVSIFAKRGKNIDDRPESDWRDALFFRHIDLVIY
ncbi:hypothetical protein ES707_19382 [subsurface metagenome]